MISIVCVFNDERVLEGRLLGSLRRQTVAHEVIAVDNRDMQFTTAAAALNRGATRSSGDWLLFAHQDVELLSPDWLRDAEQLLQAAPRLGWAGVAGCPRTGEKLGFVLDRQALFGAPFKAPRRIQTLDECVLFHPREMADHNYFDEGLTGWHAYGVEACCAALRAGRQNYIISLPTWHDSKSTNLQGLEEAHAYVWRKHGAALRRIATTCGILPDAYGWGAGRSSRLPARASRRLGALAARLSGFRHRYVNFPGEALEELTRDEPVVESLHRRAAGVAAIEARAFVPQPDASRRVVHRFRGLDYQDVTSDCVVIAADLAAEIGDLREATGNLPASTRRLLLCFNLKDVWKKFRLWGELRRRSVNRVLVMNSQGMPPDVVIFEIRRG